MLAVSMWLVGGISRNGGGLCPVTTQLAKVSVGFLMGLNMEAGKKAKSGGLGYGCKISLLLCLAQRNEVT